MCSIVIHIEVLLNEPEYSKSRIKYNLLNKTVCSLFSFRENVYSIKIRKKGKNIRTLKNAHRKYCFLNYFFFIAFSFEISS